MTAKSRGRMTGVLLSLFLVIALLLGACSGTAAPTATPTTKPAASPTSPPVAIAPSPTPGPKPTDASPSPTTVSATPTPSPKPTDVPPSPTRIPATPTKIPSAAAGKVEVHFIDVGQGDAILILTSDGKAALIDGGEAGSGVVSYLKGKGVQKLDVVVATHPHADHIGGLIEVLGAIPVAEVIANGQPHTTLTYERFLDAIARAKAQYREVRRGDTIQLGSLALNVLHPTGPTGTNLNNQSVALRLVHGQTVFLFVGDAEKEAEASMLLSSVFPVKADVLKVGHHASRTASSPQFLELVKPQVAVYSAGAGNTYGHPHQETLSALASAGAMVYGTDVHGTVIVTAEGSGYSVTTAKTGEPRAPPAATSPTAVPAAPTAMPASIQPTPTPATQQATLTLDIVSVTSPVAPNANATLSARTSPGADCAITVYYKSGPSSAAGLGSKVADASGNVTWTWKVGANTTPGTWRIVVTASKDGQKVTKETTFVVR